MLCFKEAYYFVLAVNAANDNDHIIIITTNIIIIFFLGNIAPLSKSVMPLPYIKAMLIKFPPFP